MGGYLVNEIDWYLGVILTSVVPASAVSFDIKGVGAFGVEIPALQKKFDV